MTALLYATVYAPDDLPTEVAHIASKSLGTVNEASELEYKKHLRGSGALKISINRHHPQAALLVQDRYLIVHGVDGPVGGGFLDEATVDLSHTDGPGAEFLTWTGMGQMGILRNGRMDATSNIAGGHAPIDGYWALDNQGIMAGASNGHAIPMLKRALVEMQLNSPSGISVVDHSSWTYDLDTDAVAVPFVPGEVQGANVGDDALSLLAQMSQLGDAIFVMDHLFKLDAHLSYGTDKSGAFGAGTVRFAKGVNVAAAIQRKVRGAVNRTHLIVGGAERTFVTVVDPAYVSGDVVRWGFLSVPETADPDGLEAAGLAHIEARKRQTDTFTFPQHDHGDVPVNGIYEPGVHYDVGDTVSHHTGTGDYDANEQASPVAAISWVLKTGDEANGDYEVTPEIGSTFHWDGEEAFTGSAPGSQHRFLLCPPRTEGGTASCSLSPDLMTQIATPNSGFETGTTVNWTLAGIGSTGVDGPATGAWEGNYYGFVNGAGSASYTGLASTPFLIGVPYVFRILTDSAGLSTFFRISDPTGSANYADVVASTGGSFGEVCLAWTPSATVAGIHIYVAVDSGLDNFALDDLRVYTGVAILNPLNGTTGRAQRCDHSEHEILPRDPTVDDDAAHGYPIRTLWTNTITAEQWISTDATEGAAVWLALGGGVTDHGALTGLADDDHPQYLTAAEGDADYADLVHTHGAPAAGFHGVLVQRTTDFAAANSNDANPDFDTEIYDTDSLWAIGSPKILGPLPASYDGKMIRLGAWVGFQTTATGFVETKIYRNVTPGSIGTTNDDKLVLGGVAQHTPNNYNTWITHLTSAFPAATGDTFCIALKSGNGANALDYHSVSILFGLEVVEPGEGAQGVPGEGVPVGGTVGQALVKNSATNYDTAWGDAATAPADDTHVWMSLSTVVAGVPELVWDGDNSLIPTLIPL